MKVILKRKCRLEELRRFHCKVSQELFALTVEDPRASLNIDVRASWDQENPKAVS